MPSLLQLLFYLFPYALRTVINDAAALHNRHKTYRNIIRLTAGSLGCIAGIVLPLNVSYIDDTVSSIVGLIVNKGQINQATGDFIGVVTMAWAGSCLGLAASKKLCQGYFFLKYHDSNSDHHLYEIELVQLLEVYPKPDMAPNQLRLKITEIFDYLIQQIRQANNNERHRKEYTIDCLHQETTKAQFKFTLAQFRLGNIDPYLTFYGLERTKEQMSRQILHERINEYYSAFNALEPNHQYGPQPEFASAEPEMSSNAMRPLHRLSAHRASISVSSLEPQNPKLSRLMTQWLHTQGRDINSEQHIADIDKLVEVLQVQAQELRSQVHAIPSPEPLLADSSLRGRPPTPLAPSRRGLMS